MTRTNDTTTAIINFLLYERHMAFRNNTTGVFDPKIKRFRKAHPTALGTGDIVGCFNGGKYFEVEVKTGSDELSDDQEKHRDKVLAVRGIYIEAKTYDDFRAQYDRIMRQYPAMSKHFESRDNRTNVPRAAESHGGEPFKRT